MVKCNHQSDDLGKCTKVAFYGTIFQQPEVCKIHIKDGMISVRKKCSDCNNAVAGKLVRCSRCAAVYKDIDMYREAKISELNDSIGALTVTDRPPTPGNALKKKAKRSQLPAPQN